MFAIFPCPRKVSRWSYGTIGHMESAAEVLGIEVSVALLAQWATWFAPESQPFVLPAGSALASAGRPFEPANEMELLDTFELYARADGAVIRSFTQDEFTSLPRALRSELVRLQLAQGRAQVPSVRAWSALRPAGISQQADGHRFVWWPSLLHGREREVLVPYVEKGRRASRHGEISATVWAGIAGALPRARELAGAFPHGSGPNCFGIVMGAAGVSDAASTWMQREPFEEWLSDVTEPGGRDDEPGTVLLWRSASGLVQHAAVTLGDGWALHKPSQGWMSPVKVLPVRDLFRSARESGRRVSRRVLA